MDANGPTSHIQLSRVAAMYSRGDDAVVRDQGSSRAIGSPTPHFPCCGLTDALPPFQIRVQWLITANLSMDCPSAAGGTQCAIECSRGKFPPWYAR